MEPGEPKEQLRTYSVEFDKSHFGEQEFPQHWIDEEIGRGNKRFLLPGALNKWVAKICNENNINLKDEHKPDFFYYLMEIAGNAMENVGKGKIEITISDNGFSAVVTDEGKGFEGDINNNIKKGHGLDQIISYSTDFLIESNGKKFEKKEGKEELIESLDTDVSEGTRITFSKIFKK